VILTRGRRRAANSGTISSYHHDDSAYISKPATARTTYVRVPYATEGKSQKQSVETRPLPGLVRTLGFLSADNAYAAGRGEARSNALKPVFMPPPPRSSLKSAEFDSSLCDTDRCEYQMSFFEMWGWSDVLRLTGERREEKEGISKRGEKESCGLVAKFCCPKLISQTHAAL
jgi:hypothetical protein